MKSIIAAPAAAWGVFAILTGGAYGALPLAHPGPTVNDYTAVESQRAEAAARSAGFDNLEITMVQDGNFFLNGHLVSPRMQISGTAQNTRAFGKEL